MAVPRHGGRRDLYRSRVKIRTDLGIGKLIGLSGYINKYQLREPSTFSIAPATSGDIGTELAVYAEMQVFDDHLYVSPLYSVLFPGDGYKSVYGNDDNVHNFQFVTILTY